MNILGWSSRLAVASAGVLLLVGIGVAAYEDHFAARLHRREIHGEAAILARSVAAAVQFEDRAAAEEYLNALKANPEIRSAAAYDDRGISIGAVSRRGSNSPKANLEAVKSNPSEQIEFLVPVTEKGNRIGTVYLSAMPENRGTRTARLAGVVLLAAMATLVFAVLAADRAALAQINYELEKRAADLFLANERLRSETEVRRDAEEALHQSQKMEAIGQLSGGIAHDLNNYLAVIRGSLNLLKRRASQAEAEVQPYIAAALEGVDKAAGLTTRLLAFARKQPLLLQAVAPEKLIEGMLDFVRQTVGEGVAVETDLQSRWLINCDPSQLETVILNLAINARDAMPNGGRLAIETHDRTVQSHVGSAQGQSASGDFVEIMVRDNGAGMSDEVRKKALEPFFTTKPHGRGTGLGLSTAFGYIRQSGGNLSIESSPGKGTAIIILMPRYIAQKQSGGNCTTRNAA